MRNRNTVEFLGIWETLHNPNFNPFEFEGFRKEAGLNAFTLSPTRWIEATNAIGIISQAGRYGGTFAQTDIAVSDSRKRHIADRLSFRHRDNGRTVGDRWGKRSILVGSATCSRSVYDLMKIPCPNESWSGDFVFIKTHNIFETRPSFCSNELQSYRTIPQFALCYCLMPSRRNIRNPFGGK